MSDPITSLQQIADLGFTASKGKKPETGERELTVLFRGGRISKHTYRAAQLRWSIEDHPFDIVGWR